MLRIRTLDERMMTLQRQGRIGFYGTCSGQEAATIGTAMALRPTDWIFPALREAGVMLMRGYGLVPYLSQVFGNSGDPARGRQMPSHQSSRSVNQVSWSSCIGSQITQATGAAMAAKFKKDGAVVMGYMGDGATSSADFHTGLNFAGVFKAPVVFVCQNNHWSISIPTKGQTAAESIAVKAQAYGFPGVKVDGNDVEAASCTKSASSLAPILSESLPRTMPSLSLNLFCGPPASPSASYALSSSPIAFSAGRCRSFAPCSPATRKSPSSRAASRPTTSCTTR
jgi:pyruvate dehydrogenase E1 component alpha subunit/2-oxoisovalerate dehydrogenase E1 component alpha subunit